MSARRAIARRAALSGLLALGGCVVVEAPDTYDAPPTAAQRFYLRCVEGAYAEALGCALTCGRESARAFEPHAALLRFIGQATFTPSAAARLDASVGELTWVECPRNAFGGRDCSARTTSARVECGPDALLLFDDDDRVRATFPAAVFESTPLPAMADGRLAGAPGSCMSACVAAATRPACDDGCGDGEGCWDTGWSRVCHRRGRGDEGARCAGPEDCRYLACDEETGRCE